MNHIPGGLQEARFHAGSASEAEEGASEAEEGCL